MEKYQIKITAEDVSDAFNVIVDTDNRIIPNLCNVDGTKALTNEYSRRLLIALKMLSFQPTTSDGMEGMEVPVKPETLASLVDSLKKVDKWMEGLTALGGIIRSIKDGKIDSCFNQ